MSGRAISSVKVEKGRASRQVLWRFFSCCYLLECVKFAELYQHFAFERFGLHFLHMRSQLKNLWPRCVENSVATFPPHTRRREATIPNSVYRIRDFWYLTGFPEPDAIAVIDPRQKSRIRFMFVREISRWRRGLAAVRVLMGGQELRCEHQAFPIEKFSVDLGKLLDGHDVFTTALLSTRLLISRFSVIFRTAAVRR